MGREKSWFSLRKDRPYFRFGVCEPYFKDRSSPEVWRQFEIAVERVRASGCLIESVELPDGFELVHVMHRRIMAAEAAAIHRQEFTDRRDDYSPHVARLLEEGITLSAVDYAGALFHRERFERNVGRWLWLWNKSAQYPLDAILIPATPTTAPTTESTGDPMFNSPWSYARKPSATIPIAVDAAGLPIGMQVSGLMERDTLEAAKICAAAIKWGESPSLLQELS
jgi:aspartyl-tRNA(Asn)/glutamyl-tRNA(Gln) amidotransferase subunit A